jgi:hypothetical protein
MERSTASVGWGIFRCRSGFRQGAPGVAPSQMGFHMPGSCDDSRISGISRGQQSRNAWAETTRFLRYAEAEEPYRESPEAALPGVVVKRW